MCSPALVSYLSTSKPIADDAESGCRSQLLQGIPPPPPPPPLPHFFMLVLAAASGFCFELMSAGLLAWSPLGEYAHAVVSWASFFEASFLMWMLSNPFPARVVLFPWVGWVCNRLKAAPAGI